MFCSWTVLLMLTCKLWSVEPRIILFTTLVLRLLLLIQVGLCLEGFKYFYNFLSLGSKYCVVQILKSYLEKFDPALDSVFLFPANQNSPLKEVSYQKILSGFRATLRAMNIESSGSYTLHSPRTGGLSEAANSGLCSAAELTRHGRWKAGSSVPETYRKLDISCQLKASRSLLINSF